MKPLFVPLGSDLPLDDLGGKGYHLSRMVNLGLPVPPGIVIPTYVCREWMTDPAKVEAELRNALAPILSGFIVPNGDGNIYPVSVRSGARFSMPGMMDTILNLGLEVSENASQFELESLKRFYVMYGNVVAGAERGDLERESLLKLISQYKAPLSDQLFNCIVAVFASWNNDRAKVYRDLHNIPHDLGTAVIIQRMVFGNLNENSATGVLFTRCPASGVNEFVGEFLVKAQGEDIVAGIRTPDPISKFPEWNSAISTELFDIATSLELKSKDVQDIEFTVEDGKLWILQTRNAKRTSRAAVRIVNDLVKENVLSYEEAVTKVSLKAVLAASQPEIDPSFTESPVASGIGASSGVATGVAVFSSAEAVASKVPCILVTEETNPDDIPGINAAEGILTATGGSTSHAAVVARGLNKVAVVGCSDLKKTLKGWLLSGKVVAGQQITIDGVSGRIWLGVDVPILSGENPEVSKFKEMVRTKNRKTWKLAESATDVSEIGTIYRAEIGTASEAALAVMKMKRGVIDLRGSEEIKLPDFEESVIGLFGTKSLIGYSLEKHCAALLKKSVKRKEIYVVLPSEGCLSLKQNFEAQGYRIVCVSDDPAEILTSDEYFGLEDPKSVSIYSGLSKVKKSEGSRVFPLFYSEVDKSPVIGVTPLTDTALLQVVLGG